MINCCSNKTVGTLVATLSVLATQNASLVKAQSLSTPRTVFVHLFEWKWADIAKECETHLGPQGYAAVQISPPNEHAIINNNDDEVFPWWQRYQPVSYSLENSRSGTIAELEDMITRCNAVGVDIYADAVINHMIGGGEATGSNGSSVTKYNYPDVPYGPLDFHIDGVDFPEFCNRGIDPDNDYATNPSNAVRRCELVGLADLNTTQDNVRETIANYLISLAELGVRGFRIDAAKHMNPEDIDNIIQRVNDEISPNPYFFLEVIDPGNEAITVDDYFGVNSGEADITEFKYGKKVGRKFLNSPYGDGSGRNEKISELKTLSPSWDLMDSTKSIIFTDNHDEQRNGEPYVTYKNGTLYDLINVFMLAWPYGYPKVMSSYEFSAFNQGPPSDSEGNTNDIYVDGSNEPNCFDEWKCEHRWRPISNMVAFRNYTQPNFAISNWWDNGANQIAFGRGDRGFVVINRENGPDLSRNFQTSLPEGNYCNIIEFDYDAISKTCTGETIEVDASGIASISLKPFSAVAIHGGAKVP